MNMEAFVLGSGGSMPLPHRSLTSVLLRREGDLFLFDCGEGTQVSMRRLNLRWKKINTIFISHTHADHVTGLPGMLMLSSQVARDEPLYVIGPPRIAEYVDQSRRVLEMYINYEIVVREIEAPAMPQTVFMGDGYRVDAFPLRHTRTCVGYSLVEDGRPGVFHPERASDLGVPRGPAWARLQAGQSVELGNGTVVYPEDVLGEPRSGRKFSYVTDTLPIDEIAPAIADSDLVMMEGMYEHNLAQVAHEKKHMTGLEAARLAVEAGGVRRLGLIHFSPRYTDREVRAIEIEAVEVFPDAFAARDRMRIDIPYADVGRHAD